MRDRTESVELLRSSCWEDLECSPRWKLCMTNRTVSESTYREGGSQVELCFNSLRNYWGLCLLRRLCSLKYNGQRVRWIWRNEHWRAYPWDAPWWLSYCGMSRDEVLSRVKSTTSSTSSESAVGSHRSFGESCRHLSAYFRRLCRHRLALSSRRAYSSASTLWPLRVTVDRCTGLYTIVCRGIC